MLIKSLILWLECVEELPAVQFTQKHRHARVGNTHVCIRLDQFNTDFPNNLMRLYVRLLVAQPMDAGCLLQRLMDARSYTHTFKTCHRHVKRLPAARKALLCRWTWRVSFEKPTRTKFCTLAQEASSERLAQTRTDTLKNEPICSDWVFTNDTVPTSNFVIYVSEPSRRQPLLDLRWLISWAPGLAGGHLLCDWKSRGWWQRCLLQCGLTMTAADAPADECKQLYTHIQALTHNIIASNMNNLQTQWRWKASSMSKLRGTTTSRGARKLLAIYKAAETREAVELLTQASKISANNKVRYC